MVFKNIPNKILSEKEEEEKGEKINNQDTSQVILKVSSLIIFFPNLNGFS